jgi:Ni/Co efflux regulator RcnB
MFNMLDEITRKQIGEDQGKIGNETEVIVKRFAVQFKTQMFDTLTDAQWLRLQNMVDNPTRPVKMMLDKMKAGRENKEKKDEWMPGPNSWRPGDPIPEQYRQERNERRQLFPRGE